MNSKVAYEAEQAVTHLSIVQLDGSESPVAHDETIILFIGII